MTRPPNGLTRSSIPPPQSTRSGQTRTSNHRCSTRTDPPAEPAVALLDHRSDPFECLLERVAAVQPRDVGLGSKPRPLPLGEGDIAARILLDRSLPGEIAVRDRPS